MRLTEKLLIKLCEKNDNLTLHDALIIETKISSNAQKVNSQVNCINKLSVSKYSRTWEKVKKKTNWKHDINTTLERTMIRKNYK